MKFCIFVIFACLQVSLPLAQGQTIRDRINEYIRELKNIIPEPVYISDTDYTLPENDYVEGYLNITNGVLSGLREFNIDVEYRGVIIPIPTAFTITIHNLDSYRDFLSSLEFYNYSQIVYDNEGSFRTVTTDVVIKGEVDFNPLPLSFSVTSLWYNVGGIQFDIQGIVSERFSQVLSVILSNTVANSINLLQEPLSTLLVDIINGFINGIFGELQKDIDYQNISVIADQEKVAEALGRFFDELNKVLGLTSS